MASGMCKNFNKPANFVTIFSQTEMVGGFFVSKYPRYCQILILVLTIPFPCMYFLTLEKISPIFLIVNSESPKKDLVSSNEMNQIVGRITYPNLLRTEHNFYIDEEKTRKYFIIFLNPY